MESEDLNKIQLLGDRTVILLEEAKDHTVTSGGITVPLSTVYETDGGRLATKTSARKHLSKGKIVLMSPLAETKLKESIPDIKIGDTVYVPEGAHSTAYQFYPSKNALVLDYKGYICVPHSLIEARYGN